MRVDKRLHFRILTEKYKSVKSGIPQDAQTLSHTINLICQDVNFRNKALVKFNFTDIQVSQESIGRLRKYLFPKQSKNELIIDIYTQLPAAPLFNLKTKQLKVFRLHDFFPTEFPRLYSWRARLLFFRRIKSLSSADLLIANSSDTASQASHYSTKSIRTEILECQTPSFTLTTNLQVNPMETSVFRIEKFVLSVGAIVRRKSPLALIDFWERQLMIYGYSLVLIGERTDMKIVKAIERKVKKYEKSSTKLLFYSDVGTEYLQYCYLNAHGFISASSFEGFNMPLHDAVVLGLPVLCHTSAIKNEEIKLFALAHGNYFEFTNSTEFISRLNSTIRPDPESLQDFERKCLLNFRIKLESLLIDMMELASART